MKFTTKDINILGVYLGIIIVMGLTPFLGFFSIPGLPDAIAIILVPVIVCSIHMGIKGTLLAWISFGIVSYIGGFYMGNPFMIDIAHNDPFKWFLLAIGSRILIGVLIVLIQISMMKVSFKYNFLVIAIASPILNTFIYIGALVILFDWAKYWPIFVYAWINIIIEWTVIPSMILASKELIKIRKAEKKNHL